MWPNNTTQDYSHVFEAPRDEVEVDLATPDETAQHLLAMWSVERRGS